MRNLRKVATPSEKAEVKNDLSSHGASILAWVGFRKRLSSRCVCPSVIPNGQGTRIGSSRPLCAMLSELVSKKKKNQKEKEDGGKRDRVREKKRGVEKEHSTKYIRTGPSSLGW